MITRQNRPRRFGKAENDGKEVADPNEDGEEEVSFNKNGKL